MLCVARRKTPPIEHATPEGHHLQIVESVIDGHPRGPQSTNGVPTLAKDRQAQILRGEHDGRDLIDGVGRFPIQDFEEDGRIEPRNAFM